MTVRISCHLWAIYAPGLIGTWRNFVTQFLFLLKNPFRFSNICLENSSNWAISNEHSIPLEAFFLTPGVETPLNAQVLQSELTFVSVSLETLITCFSKGKSIVISLSSKCLWKEKELKKTLRPGVGCRQAWNTIRENLAMLTRATLAC